MTKQTVLKLSHPNTMK